MTYNELITKNKDIISRLDSEISTSKENKKFETPDYLLDIAKQLTDESSRILASNEVIDSFEVISLKKIIKAVNLFLSGDNLNYTEINFSELKSDLEKLNEELAVSESIDQVADITNKTLQVEDAFQSNKIDSSQVYKHISKLKNSDTLNNTANEKLSKAVNGLQKLYKNHYNNSNMSQYTDLKYSQQEFSPSDAAKISSTADSINNFLDQIKNMHDIDDKIIDSTNEVFRLMRRMNNFVRYDLKKPSPNLQGMYDIALELQIQVENRNRVIAIYNRNTETFKRVSQFVKNKSQEVKNLTMQVCESIITSSNNNTYNVYKKISTLMEALPEYYVEDFMPIVKEISSVANINYEEILKELQMTSSKEFTESKLADETKNQELEQNISKSLNFNK